MNRNLYKDIITLMSSVFSVVITTINVSCIYVILSTRKLRRKQPMIFIVNLLATYLLQGVFVLPIYAVLRSGEYDDAVSYPYICDAWRLSYMLTFYGMCVNVLLIAVDRFLATKYALSRKIKLTSKTCRVVCLLAWLYIILLCLVPFVPLARAKSLERSQCHYNQPRAWTIFMLLVNSALPLALNLIIYLYIARKMKESSKILFARQKKYSRATLDRMALNRKLTTLTVKITLLYGVTWIPSIVYYKLVTIAPDIFSDDFYSSDTEEIVTFINKFVTFFDAVFAPLLFCYSSEDFRKAFWKKLRKRKNVISNYSVSP